MTAEDIREMSFQNVLDTILKPAGVHVGGYPEDIFLDLEEQEREKWNCNICFLVVREARECTNKHLFCHTCVFAWSLTYGENSQKCPMCRVQQRTYLPNKEVNKLINDKRVKCPADDCTFRSPLRIFLMHSHGRERFANDNVDLESLRPVRPAHAHNLIILPGGVAFTGDLQAGLPGGAQRAANIREQLQQGRAMIHQMMLLLHLEMQLRQQALVSYSQAQDPHTRLRRLDEVLALNEQLNEVGTILSALLSTPLASRPGARMQPTPPTGPRRVDVSRDVMLSRGASTSQTPSLDVLMSRGVTTAPRTSASVSASDDDDEEEDGTSDSDATSVSTVVSVAPRVRLSMTGQLHSPRGGPSAAAVAPRRADLARPQRRNEIRAQLLNPGAAANEASSSAERMTPRLLRRETQNNASLSGTQAATTTAASQSTNMPTASVSLQRLDTNVPGQYDAGTAGRDQGTSLPPLTRGSSVSRQTSTSNNDTSSQHSPRGGLTSRTPQQQADPATQTSPRSVLPAGSSAHQRILRSLSNTEDDPGGEDTTEEESPNQQHANSVARRVTGADLLRGPRITSEGVTASGAVFSTSADTPSTRAASRFPSSSSSSTVPREGVTASGATYSTTADTPLTRAASGLSRRVSDSSASTGAATAALERHSESVPIRMAAANAGFDTRLIPGARASQQAGSYAPQRRFRWGTSLVETAAGASDNRGTASGVSGGGGMSVPYVPHRSGSPGRVPVRTRAARSQSLSVDDRRRLSFSRDGEGESVVRRAARGAGRTSLPTTAGQLLRARRNSQGRRAGGGNRNDPNGTV